MQPDAYCFHRSFEPAAPSRFEMDRHYLLYALEGTLRLEAEGQRWTLPPARAALIRAGQQIEITVLSKLTSASVLYAPSFMETPKTALSVFEMTPLARELIRECRDWGPENGPLSAYSTQIFSTLAALVLKLAAEPSNFALPSPVSALLKKAVQLTEARAHSNPTFDEIALSTSQSPRALARRFSSEMGMTWREVLRHVRIMKAVEALATSDAPVTEIAFSVGYGSLSGFNAAFRELMQMSPTDYRKSFTC